LREELRKELLRDELSYELRDELLRDELREGCVAVGCAAELS
jgi:hypothetical protein